MRFFLIILLLFSFSCSFKKNPLKNQKSSGHSELYSEPDRPRDQISDHEIKIVVAATSEINGNVDAIELKFTDVHSSNEQVVTIGGKETIKKYQQILKDSFSNVILVEPGSLIDGKNSSLDSNLYSEMGYDAVTFGMSDFQINLPIPKTNTIENLKIFSEKSNTNLVVSNLVDLKTSKKIEWKGVQNQIIKDFNGVKVGILGIVPDEVTEVTPMSNRVGLFVQDMLEATLEGARALRSNGADLIIVLTNQTIQCGETLAEERKLPIRKVNFEPRKNNVCDLSSPLGRYLLRLPPNLIDVVISGNNKEKVTNYINNVLVMGAHNHGLSMVFAEFIYNKKIKAFDLEKTIVHQPVFLCQDFFKNTNDCFAEDPSINHTERIPARFLGQFIRPQLGKNLKKNQSDFEFDFNFFSQNFNVDLILKPHVNNFSQLAILELSGDELISLLEADYNSGFYSEWYGVEFQEINQILQLKLKSKYLQPSNSYKILSDLETLSKKTGLSGKIASIDNKKTNHLSWKKIFKSDIIHTRLSSPSR